MKDFILKIKGLINENKQLTSTVLKGVLAIIVFIISVGIFLVYLENKEEVKVDNDTEIEEEIEDEDIDDEYNEEIDEKRISWEEFKVKYDVEEENSLIIDIIHQNKYVDPLSFKTLKLVYDDISYSYTFTFRIPNVTFTDEETLKMKQDNLKTYNDSIKSVNDLIAAEENRENYDDIMWFSEIDYSTYIKNDLFSIIMKHKDGPWGSEYNLFYDIYNFDGNEKKSITDDELLSKFNITREDFNDELIKKTRNSVMKQIFWDKSNFGDDRISETSVINEYNKVIAEASTWRIFIDQDQDLSVYVPIAYNTHQQPFFVKVIDNI
jgi:hypothetical protein